MKTILIVDDNLDVLNSLRQALVHFGYRVIAAPDAWTALDLINFRPGVDLIITDYHMPEMNGIDLIKRLRRTVAVPVILCSAFGDQDLACRARAVGVAAILEKPYGLPLLRQVIHDALGQDPPKQSSGSQAEKCNCSVATKAL